MTTELQNKVWEILPKEFKEEVKQMSRVYGTSIFPVIFGHDNLNSNVESPEMLYVSRDKVQDTYRYNEDVLRRDPTHSGAILLKHKLEYLFGSKFLTDDCESKSKLLPKFKVGDRVLISDDECITEEFRNCIGTVVHINSFDYRTVDIGGEPGIIHIRQLKPLPTKSQPKEDVEEELNLCEILKGKEGETFYTSIWGDVTLAHLYPDNNNGSQPIINVRLKNNNTRNLAASGHICWSDTFGNIIIWPSKEYFEKYPRDAKKAWETWIDEQKSTFPLHVNFDSCRDNKCFPGEHAEFERLIEKARQAVEAVVKEALDDSKK